MTAVVAAAVTFASTLAGGLLAVKAQSRLRQILGFTAGVLIGVVAFDVLPEIFEMVRLHALEPTPSMIALVAGFLVFHAIEKIVLIHHAQEPAYAPHHHPSVGLLSAVALTGHSFLDGVGIGLAFQVSTATGVLVTLAVVAHDFADGLNTVSLVLLHGNTTRRAVIALAFDAAAPAAGLASTVFIHPPPSVLAIYLGFFAGFLLYIGAADILPEAHSKGSSIGTIVVTIAGSAFVFLVTRLLA